MLWKDALSLANVPVGSVCRDKSGKMKKSETHDTCTKGFEKTNYSKCLR